MHCPICNKQILLNEYSQHANKRYEFNKDLTLLKLHKEGEFMSFYNFKNQLERPFVVYCDFECCLIESEENELHTHEPNYVALYFVCTSNPNKNS